MIDYLEPWLEKLRRNGKLENGTKTIIDCSGKMHEYVGEMLNGIACGSGKKTFEETYVEGTFVNDVPEGICKAFDQHRIRIEGEYKAGKLFGKVTTSK